MGKTKASRNCRGAWVAIFGPDGAGKSAVIKRLAAELSPPFCRVEQFHFRPRFRRHWVDSPPVTQPHAEPPRGTLISLFKLLYWLADCWYGYLFTILPARATGRLVLFDRYFHDIVVDPWRYRLPLASMWFARLLLSLAPRPDLFILLDVTPDEVLRRKSELPSAELQRQRMAYAEMLGRRRNAVVVNADRSLEEVTQRAGWLIAEHRTPDATCRVVALEQPSCDLAGQVFAALPRQASAATAAQAFLAVPGHGTPRWLLPAEDHRIEQALASWSPYRPASRIKWAAIRAAQRAGCLSGLPGVGRVQIPGVADIEWSSVGWRGNSPPVPVTYVGTPGVARKAVIHLVNRESGACEAIVKTPLTERARAAILREADVLTTLAAEGFRIAPRLLYVDRQCGVTTQTALNGKPAGRKFTAEYGALLQSLLLEGESTTTFGHAAEWRENLVCTAEGEAGIEALSAGWTELSDMHSVPACWVHGDFAPWNIRHLPDGSIVLLDWEEAQRSGLPLQDGFHFLHIQDYLFGARPSAHSDEMHPVAKSLGISPALGRKLEIAYLTHSYLKRLELREAEHAKYLLQTLHVALQNNRRRLAQVIGFPVETLWELAPSAAFSSCPRRLRADLFAAVIAQLNRDDVPYCVLSGHENRTRNNSSDVDFMFHPRDLQRLAPLLAQAAQRAGARLIQAMPHETGACYFVIAKEDSGKIGYFDPDCTADYRSRGRLWLPSEGILARRRRCKDADLPAVSDEFAYYLVKKVLKQSVNEFQLRRLRHLYQRSPVICRAEALKFWPLATVRSVERALVADDLPWFQSHLAELLAELNASEHTESFHKRAIQKMRDAVRVVRRILRPTGMSVLICGGKEKQRAAIANGLAQQLAPAFRRTATVHLDFTGMTGPAPSIGLSSRIAAARVRSTLVVTAVEGERFARGISRWLARVLFQPDLIFVVADSAALSSDEPAGYGCAHSQSGQVLCLDAGLSTERNVQQASRAVITWLAARQGKRFSLSQEHSSISRERPLPEELPGAAGLHLVVK